MRDVAIMKLAVVSPVFNEAEVLPHFHERLRVVLAALDGVESRIIYVMDPGTDDSETVLRNIVASDPRASAIILSSRFGHQMSLLAGIEAADGSDAIVMMDSDLQHPPELIPVLIDQFHKGGDIVYTVREDSEDVSGLRSWCGRMFYRFLQRMASCDISANAADFRLISARVGKLLTHSFPERNMFLRGLFSWVGFRQVPVSFKAHSRFAGKSKYSIGRMIQLGVAGIISFSTKPLQAGVFFGFLCALVAFALLAATLVAYLIDKSIPTGWTTIVAIILLFGGIQLIFLGVVGVYVGGIYDEVKGRPRYIVDRVYGFNKEKTMEERS